MVHLKKSHFTAKWVEYSETLEQHHHLDGINQGLDLPCASELFGLKYGNWNNNGTDL